jgi:hypothetical protein
MDGRNMRQLVRDQISIIGQGQSHCEEDSPPASADGRDLHGRSSSQSKGRVLIFAPLGLEGMFYIKA